MLAPSDITMVIAVRSHDANPWIPERLALIPGYYDPAPAVHIVDFGSQGRWRDVVQALCREAGFAYTHEDDRGSFCPARARNLGAAKVSSTIVFFCDADCLGERDLFGRLAELANAIDLANEIDQIINLPAYHLTAAATRAVLTAPDPSCAVRATLARAVYTPFGEYVDMVAPYSNVFAVHRDFFFSTGGFNERFRGHGSEDFEYLLRFAIVSGRFPLPEDLVLDRFAPLDRTFTDHDKPYRGFRRLFELMSFQAEAAGLRVAHLHHPKPPSDPWLRAGDRDRARFCAEVQRYLDDPSTLADYRWLPAPSRLEALQQRPASPSSYAAGRLSLGASGAPPGSVARRLRKLARDPRRFFEDSRHSALRWLARRW